jgi:hypothetical protein
MNLLDNANLGWIFFGVLCLGNVLFFIWQSIEEGVIAEIDGLEDCMSAPTPSAVELAMKIADLAVEVDEARSEAGLVKHSDILHELQHELHLAAWTLHPELYGENYEPNKS